MHDWYLILTPLFVVPIVLLFAFTGCSLVHAAAPPVRPRPVPAPPTLMQPTLQLLFDGGSSGPVIQSVTFSWTIADGSGTVLARDSATIPVGSARDMHALARGSSGNSLGYDSDPGARFFQLLVGGAAAGTWSIFCQVALFDAAGHLVHLPSGTTAAVRVAVSSTDTMTHRERWMFAFDTHGVPNDVVWRALP